MPEAGDTVSDASWTIVRMETRSLDADSALALLHSDDYKHYTDAFAQSDTAWTWMRENIPFFDCPDKQMEEIYYFRWWSLFKHIKSTPVGYGMTEFLVPRSYADKYNLISSALGHHIHESRWLRNPKWLDGIINTWYHGNDGQRMPKLTFYSQWAAASIWDRYLVDGRKQWVTSLLPALVSENRWWDNHRWVKDGRYDLYWQTDVRDAMEETISGGRHTKNARPSINSYMYGNDRAISNIAALAAQTAPKVRADSLKLLSDEYRLKADTLRQLVLTKLWNDSARFFEVLHPDGTSANVRRRPASCRGTSVSHKVSTEIRLWRYGTNCLIPRVSVHLSASRPLSGAIPCSVPTARVPASGTERCGLSPPHRRSRRLNITATVGRHRTRCPMSFSAR